MHQLKHILFQTNQWIVVSCIVENLLKIEDIDQENWHNDSLNLFEKINSNYVATQVKMYY